MRISVIDANERTSESWAGITASVVGQWLAAEVESSRHSLVNPETSPDVVLLAHSGVVDFRKNCRRALRKYRVPVNAETRHEDPYVIVGGPIDAAPTTALEIADALAVGEAYRFVRDCLACTTVGQMRQVATDSPHAIARSQIAGLERDEQRPWLLAKSPGPLAQPDGEIDWNVADVKSDDHVVRVIGSKGCHLKCGFCATTYRQEYQSSGEGRLRARVDRANAAGERVQILSNDPLNLPGWQRVSGKLDHASLTVMELMDWGNLSALIARRPRIIRVGMEGVSERIRRNFGKAVADTDFLDRMLRLHRARVNTHSFWIGGAPFESVDDWGEWQTLMMRLNAGADWGIHRAKISAFQPSPPAPLGRFLPPTAPPTYTRDAVMGWRTDETERLSRVLIVCGGQSDAWRDRVAESLGVVKAQLPERDDTLDLAPTVDDYARMPSELVAWPIRREVRHKVGEVYKRRMTEGR